MRWLVYALLAANAALFAWELRHLEPPQTEPVAAAPEGPALVNRLLLLSEVKPGELRERVPVEPPPPPEPESKFGVAQTEAGEAGESGDENASSPQRPNALCLSIGPIDEEEQAGQLSAWIEREGGSAALRVGQRRELALYWIYFPPMRTRAEAVERVEQLRAEGIDDIYIIPRGDMANAVSLGVYSRRTSLDRRIAELRRNGYDPSIAPRYRNRRATWIDAAFPTPDAFPRKRFDADFAALEFQQTRCSPDQIAALKDGTRTPAETASGTATPDAQGAGSAPGTANESGAAGAGRSYYRDDSLATGGSGEESAATAPDVSAGTSPKPRAPADPVF